MKTEKDKGKGFMSKAKEEWDRVMPEYRFLNMNNLRDKFGKILTEKVEQLWMEDEDEDEAEGDMMENVEMDTNIGATVDELDGMREPYTEESEYDLEATKDSLTEYEIKLMELTKAVIMKEVSERKIRRISQTPKKGR